MKHLTPQEMIDMPGAGKAEKHLRDTGMWSAIDHGDTMEELRVAILREKAALSQVEHRFNEAMQEPK